VSEWLNGVTDHVMVPDDGRQLPQRLSWSGNAQLPRCHPAVELASIDEASIARGNEGRWMCRWRVISRTGSTAMTIARSPNWRLSVLTIGAHYRDQCESAPSRSRSRLLARGFQGAFQVRDTEVDIDSARGPRGADVGVSDVDARLPQLLGNLSEAAR
jgi:hypothetical protein